MKSDSKPKKGQSLPSPIKKHLDQLKAVDDVLYREITIDGNNIQQLAMYLQY